MKLPEKGPVHDVAEYWGIKSCIKFRNMLLNLNINTKIVYFVNGKQTFVRNKKLLDELYYYILNKQKCPQL